MRRSVRADPAGPSPLRLRALGALMIAGGVLAIVTALAPPDAGHSDSAVLAVGALAIAIGAGALLTRREVGEAALGAATVLGTALITLATYAGSGEGTGTADNEMLYVWVCLYSFYFFSLPHAVAQLGVVALAYAWLLWGDPLDEALTRWLVTVGTLLVAGLLVARLRASLGELVNELSQHARQDSLTGLLNRRALEERAAVEFARAGRDGNPIGLLVTDVDRFKALNDSLGHPAGDQVLRGVAAALQSSTRAGDAPARIGGDEFALLLPGASRAEALAVANRVREAIRRAADEMRVKLTVSIGIASGAGAEQSLDGLWRAADRAMYSAKHAGGDLVHVAGETAAHTLGEARAAPEPDA